MVVHLYVNAIVTLARLFHYVFQFPSFMFCWVSLTLLKPASFAIISKVFSTYLLDTFFLYCVPSNLLLKLVAASVQILITLLNCLSVNSALRVQVSADGQDR